MRGEAEANPEIPRYARNRLRNPLTESPPWRDTVVRGYHVSQPGLGQGRDVLELTC